MKTTSKLISILMTLIMVSTMLSISVFAEEDNILTVGTGGEYATIQNALQAAKNGDVVTLLQDFNGYVYYQAIDDNVITIDGQGHKITGENTTNWKSVALHLGGRGIVKLKDINLIGGTTTIDETCGLSVSNLVNIQSYGTVTAIGGYAVSTSYQYTGYSYGVMHDGVGNVDITNAYGGQADESIGVYNQNAGAVNVVNAVGGTACKWSYGVLNDTSGTINAFAATGGASPNSTGVFNNKSGTVNVATATGGTASGSSYGVLNQGTGTINVTIAIGGKSNYSSFNSVAAANGQYSITNVGSLTGRNSNNMANLKVKTIKLHKEEGSYCVLDSIVVAESGDTNVGTLPSVFYEDEYYYNWYYDNAEKYKIRGTADANDIYSECYAMSNLGGTPPISDENTISEESIVVDESQTSSIDENPITGDSGSIKYIVFTVTALLFLSFMYVGMKNRKKT